MLFTPRESNKHHGSAPYSSGILQRTMAWKKSRRPYIVIYKYTAFLRALYIAFTGFPVLGCFTASSSSFRRPSCCFEQRSLPSFHTVRRQGFCYSPSFFLIASYCVLDFSFFLNHKALRVYEKIFLLSLSQLITNIKIVLRHFFFVHETK